MATGTINVVINRSEYHSPSMVVRHLNRIEPAIDQMLAISDEETFRKARAELGDALDYATQDGRKAKAHPRRGKARMTDQAALGRAVGMRLLGAGKSFADKGGM